MERYHCPIKLLIRGSDTQKKKGMASPLIGIAGVNSLLFTSYAVSKRLISPFPELSLKEIAAAGALAGTINSVLASPSMLNLYLTFTSVS